MPLKCRSISGQKELWGVCGQRMPWSACASAQADPGLRCPLKGSSDIVDNIYEKQYMCLDQFRCLHTPNSLKASFLMSRIIRDPSWENVSHMNTRITKPRTKLHIHAVRPGPPLLKTRNIFFKVWTVNMGGAKQNFCIYRLSYVGVITSWRMACFTFAVESEDLLRRSIWWYFWDIFSISP